MKNSEFSKFIPSIDDENDNPYEKDYQDDDPLEADYNELSKFQCNDDFAYYVDNLY